MTNVIVKDFENFMSWIGKAEKVVYADIVKYAPPVAKLAEMLFPAQAVAIADGESAALDATTLIQNAVLMVEQKYAASAAATGTGTQKSAEVLTLTSAAVSSLLAQDGHTASATFIQNIVSAVVAVLNVTAAPATA